MQLIQTGADNILQLAFQQPLAGLAILSERNGTRELALVPAVARESPTRFVPVPFGRGVLLSPDGQHIAGFSEKGAVFCRDLRASFYWQVHFGRCFLQQLMYSANSAYLGAFGNASLGRTVVVRCTLHNPALVTQTVLPGWPQSLALHPDGRLAIYCCNTLMLQDCAELAAPVSWPLPFHVERMYFSPDGCMLACCAGALVTLWHSTQQRQIQALIGHTALVSAVAFSPSNRVLLTGSCDRTVKLWDAQTGQLICTYEWPIGAVAAVTVSADGLRAAAGDNAGQVVIWDLDET